MTLLIIKVSIKKDKFYFENSGGQDTQGGGEDTPGNFAPPPRGASCPRVSSPPGVKLPRGQDKPVHRMLLKMSSEEKRARKICVILTSRKQSHAKIPWFFITFKFHYFSMHGFFFSHFACFPEPVGTPDRLNGVCQCQFILVSDRLCFFPEIQSKVCISATLVLSFKFQVNTKTDDDMQSWASTPDFGCLQLSSEEFVSDWQNYSWKY